MKERPIIFSAPMVLAILDGRKTQTRRVVKPQPSAKSDRAFVGMDNVWRFSHQTLSAPISHASDDVRCPQGTPGTSLWVREALGVTGQGDCEYLADRREIHDERTAALCDRYGDSYHFSDVKTVSPIFMPRWASRITLEVTGVRVERVQGISEADAMAEGCVPQQFAGPWWQGYVDIEGRLMHQQFLGAAPPDWMIEPKRMEDTPHLDRSARDMYRAMWYAINGKRAPWDSNPWVWVIEFRRIAP